MKWVSTLAALLLLFGCTQPPQPPGVVEGPAPAPAPAPTPAPAPEPVAYDLVIKGGRLVDGTGRPGYLGDLALQGEKIVAVGALPPYTAQRVIDAKGLVVAPGFINPHSHTHDDLLNPFIERDAKASLMQGITTELGGVDGRSPVDIGAEIAQLTQEGTGVNFGLFLGQGSVRATVMGQAAGPANPEQLEAMKELVRRGMEAGAFGLSTGLEYLPGRYAGTDELTALVAEIQPYGGIYSTHLRSEGDQLLESLDEALLIGRQAGVPVNLAHLKIVHYRNWTKEAQVIARMEQAIQEGQQLFADIYPYLAPDYAVNRPLAEWATALPPAHLLIVDGAEERLHGKSVAEAATLLGLPAEEAAAGLLERYPGTRVVALVSSESAMRRFYQAPWALVSTDGEAQPKLESPAQALAYAFHRRSYGSYPQLLGTLVREQRLLSLEEAIRKSTGQVADLLGIKSRGYLAPGKYADVVIFNAETISDKTTWLHPQEYPEGIAYVLVNGQLAVAEGQWVEGRPGRLIKLGE